MRTALLTGIAAAAIALVPLAASAQSGGDAGSANKNVGSAASAPQNQSGATDSRATGATAPAPGRSSGGVMTTTTVAPGASVMIGTDQRTRIKNYVTERNIRPVTVKERIAVGATLPTEVELQTVPADWGPEVSSYSYIYSDDHVVLVEPSSRRVVQVID